MGWFSLDFDGVSFQGSNQWGDVPADILMEAVDEINEVFQEHIGRPVTEDELRAGLEFSLSGRRWEQTNEQSTE